MAAAALLYGLFALTSKPHGYERFAHDALARLTVLRDPPALAGRLIYDGEGRPHRLAEFRGQVMLVNYWGTWCAPCVGELPTLAALQRRFEGRMRVITVAVDRPEQTERAKAELARLSAGALPFLQEPTMSIMFDAGAVKMPTSILYDAQGRELARVMAGADWSSEEAAALIEAALAEERR